MNKLYSTLISFLFAVSSMAQIPEAPTNLQSPNSASLGVYGEVPVSLFTGVPEVSIPLFKAPEKYNNFSISLSHHTGGVHPDQHPGWVGTNWSLLAGGCITRIKRDTEDELKPINQTKGIGYYYSHYLLDKDDWNSNQNIEKIVLDNKGTEYSDTQPDEFSFNFNGYSGKFYLNEHGEWIVQCNKPLKVLFDGNFIDVPSSLLYKKGTNFLMTDAQRERSLTFKSFTIIADDGTKYIFGNTNNAIEYSMPFFNQLQSKWVANAWYLTEILYAHGARITLDYQRGSYINQMYLSNNKIITQENIYDNEPLNCYQTDNTQLDIDHSYQGELISPIYLTSINSPDFNINFQTGSSYELRYDNKIYEHFVNQFNWPSDPRASLPYLFDIQDNQPLSKYWESFNWEQLFTISVSRNDTILKKYSLRYNTAVGATGDPRYTSKERSFLMSLTEDDIKKYIFEYDNKDKLPPYLANKTDHWGFFNNNYADLNINTYFDNKQSNEDALKYGSLIKITYPTGGTTEFAYEANQYGSQVKLNRWEGVEQLSSNLIAGGLRIKKITSRPNNGIQPMIKEYFYTKNYDPVNQSTVSSGVLGSRPAYLFDAGYITMETEENGLVDAFKGLVLIAVPQLALTIGETLLNNVVLLPDRKYLIVKRRLFSSQSVLPVCSNSMGSHIGYSEVTEKLSDGSYTKYKFSNIDNGYIDEMSENVLQSSNIPYQLCNSRDQNRGNLLSKELFSNKNKKVMKEDFNYIQSNSNFLKSIWGRSEVVCEDLNKYFLEGTAYKIYIYSMLLDNTKRTYYNEDEQPMITQGINYSYNKFAQLVSKTTKTSDGKDLTTKIFYPNEIATNVLPYLSPNNKDYTSFASTVMGVNCLNPIIATEDYINNKLIKGVYNDYLLLPNNTPLLNNVYISGSDGTLKNIYSCNSYDSYYNPLQTTENNYTTTKAYTWGYNGLYPTSETVNELITSSYKFKPLIGMVSRKDPRSIVTNFAYDNTGKLSIVTDNNNNIVSSIKYMYSTIKANITCDANILCNTTKTAEVTLSESYASNNYKYEWTLKTKSGTIISSQINQTNAIKNSFIFTPNTNGDLILECKVTEMSTNNLISDSKEIKCYYQMSSATISTNNTICATTDNIASVNVTDGSGNFTYNWKVYPVASPSSIRTSSSEKPFLNFSAASTGYYTIECEIFDNVVKNTLTVTKNILSTNLLTVTNNFANISSFANTNGKYYNVNLVVYSTCSLIVGPTYSIGGSQCIKPISNQTKTITYNNQTWIVTFDVNGSLLVMLSSGTSYPPYQTINLGTISFNLQ